MTFNEMAEGVDEAERTLRAVNNHADRMARMLCRRLRAFNISSSTLNIFKEELKHWNRHTCRWSDQ